VTQTQANVKNAISDNFGKIHALFHLFSQPVVLADDLIEVFI
jgi:hypothetical protein